MSRKHFQALADAFRSTRPLWPHADFGRFSDPEAQARVDEWTRCVRAVGDACYASNPRFDRGRFERASGLDA